MARLRRRGGTNWLRLALKLGLLLGVRRTWASIEQLISRTGDFDDRDRERYQYSRDRLREANRALHGGHPWLFHAASFATGVGVGVGLGMLFAPASGEEIRSELRDRAVRISRNAGETAVDLTDLRERAIGE